MLPVKAITFNLIGATLSSFSLDKWGPARAAINVRDFRQIVRIARVAWQVFVNDRKRVKSALVGDRCPVGNYSLEVFLEVGGGGVDGCVVIGHGEGGKEEEEQGRFHEVSVVEGAKFRKQNSVGAGSIRNVASERANEEQTSFLLTCFLGANRRRRHTCCH